MTIVEDKARLVIDCMDLVASYTTLEGSIGAGKSTLLKATKKYLSGKGLLHTQFNIKDAVASGKKPHVYFVIDEPLDEWTSHLYSTRKFGRKPGNKKDSLGDFWRGMRQSMIVSFILILLAFSDVIGPLTYIFLSLVCFIFSVARFVFVFLPPFLSAAAISFQSPKEDISALDLFYSDKERNGFLFQVKAFTSRLSLILDQLGDIKLIAPYAHIHIIAERSLLADRTMYRNVYESGFATQAEWEIYNEFFNLITEQVVKKTTGMIYVKTSPARCQERLDRRARKEEIDKVVPEYLISLDRLNDDMVSQFEKTDPTHYVERLNFEDDVPPSSIDGIAKEVTCRLVAHVEALACLAHRS